MNERFPNSSAAARYVVEFHRVFGLGASSRPTVKGVTDEALRLRAELLLEEAQEFADAASDRDLVAMADALADVVYVAYGSALELGVDLDAVLSEVHMSNMTKVPNDGAPILRADGKVLKPTTYVPPDVHGVLLAQKRLSRNGHGGDQ